MMPTAVAITSATWPKDRRGYALGILAGGSSFFAALGPVVGGVLTAVSWRLVFLINVPLALAAIVLTSAGTPALQADPDQSPASRLGGDRRVRGGDRRLDLRPVPRATRRLAQSHHGRAIGDLRRRVRGLLVGGAAGRRSADRVPAVSPAELPRVRAQSGDRRRNRARARLPVAVLSAAGRRGRPGDRRDRVDSRNDPDHPGGADGGPHVRSSRRAPAAGRRVSRARVIRRRAWASPPRATVRSG